MAFLRAVNVGGRRVTNEQLTAAFAACGLSDVSTFLASGNVLFARPDDDLAGLVARIEAALDAAFGFPVPTTVRGPDQLRALATAEPFSADELDAAAAKPQVVLLFQPPADPAARERALTLASDSERLVFDAGDLFWLPAAGVGRSTLDVEALSAALGPFTVRTVNTITRLVAKL